MYNIGKLFGSIDYITADGINQADFYMMKNISYLKQSVYGFGIIANKYNIIYYFF